MSFNSPTATPALTAKVFRGLSDYESVPKQKQLALKIIILTIMGNGSYLTQGCPRDTSTLLSEVSAARKSSACRTTQRRTRWGQLDWTQGVLAPPAPLPVWPRGARPGLGAAFHHVQWAG